MMNVYLSIFQTFLFFFFNDTATTEIYTLSLHDALPIYRDRRSTQQLGPVGRIPPPVGLGDNDAPARRQRSEEHTSELQSRPHLVCRLLLEKKKKQPQYIRSQPASRNQLGREHCVA